MKPVTISTRSTTHSTHVIESKLDAVLQKAAQTDGASVQQFTAHDLILFTRLLEMRLFSQGVKPKHLVGTQVSYVPASPEIDNDEMTPSVIALKIVLHRTADGWRLRSVEQASRAAGSEAECDIWLSKKASADRRHHAGGTTVSSLAA